MVVHTFPKLFKKTKTGAIQEWEIKVRDTEIGTRFGQVGGAIQETVDIIRSGKNSGRANATTADQQAFSEAKSKWEKQVKKGYVEKLEDAETGKTELGGVAPMLAHSFDKHEGKIKYPCFVQPKLDGTRCIAILEHGKCTLWTRTRKPITSCPHIVKALENLFPTGCFIWDGELYNHEYKSKFEELISLIRVEKPAEGHENIQYHIYDHVNFIADFRTRTATVNSYIGRYMPNLHPVFTMEVVDKTELLKIYDKFLDDGYEGAIVRNAEGMYISNRSHDLLKLKTFEDAEFKIIGVREGRGKLTGHGIFICDPNGNSSTKGNTFDVKLDGELGRLKEIWENKDKYIGKLLTVTYQGKTAYGMPRFPVGRAIRDYE